ncbi:hypothetical protein AAC387_Pa01g2006 [Persea americana]
MTACLSGQLAARAHRPAGSSPGQLDDCLLEWTSGRLSAQTFCLPFICSRMPICSSGYVAARASRYYVCCSSCAAQVCLSVPMSTRVNPLSDLGHVWSLERGFQ